MTLLDDVARLVQRRSGLQLDAVMRARLQHCLHGLRSGCASDADLFARLSHDPALLQVLYDELTVQETSFFRDPGQFEGLVRTVLPLLPDPVVLWSAGCSYGQEAWSLAMVLAEQGRAGRVVATDLSDRALARTRAGRYAERELRGLSPERRSRWLVRDGADYCIAPALRDRVSVSRHNLAEQPPPMAGCSVVFCRNVLIYFSRDDVVATVRRFSSVLPPGGWLFLGFSETLWDMGDVFSSVRLGDAYAYRTAGAPVAAPARRGDLPDVPVLSDLGGRPPAAPPRPPGPVPRPVAGAGALAPEVAALLGQGDRALRGGLAADAVAAFRGATYLAPDLPLAHVELGLALHALGERTAARRALQTARRVLAAGGREVAGWDAGTLDRWIVDRIRAVEEDGT